MVRTRRKFSRIGGRRLRMGLATALGSLLASTLIQGAHAATPAPTPTPPPSAIGPAFVPWVAVAPNMVRTGLVVAMAGGNSGSVLWVSHDGGATWKKVAAKGWNGGRPVIAVDQRGHDILFAAAGANLQRSDDGGQSWQQASASGGNMAAVLPSFAQDGAVAVAGVHDYVVNASGATKAVRGSSGAYTDFSFQPAPSYPSTGQYAPVLLNAMDSKNLPVVLRCDQNLSCTSPTSLPNAQNGSAPASLVMSSDYAHDGVVFLQSGKGLYKSTDGGADFTPLVIVPVSGAAATTTPAMAVEPGYREGGPGRTLFASVFQIFTDPSNPHSRGGVYRSDDGGLTWHDVGSPSPLDVGSSALAIASDGRLFAGYLGTSTARGASYGLLCSANGGASWSATCPGEGSAANDPGPLQKPSNSSGSGGGGAGVNQSTSSSGGNGDAAAHGGGSNGQQDGAAIGTSGGPSGGASAGAHGLGWRWLLVLIAVALAAAAAARSLVSRVAARRRRSQPQAD